MDVEEFRFILQDTKSEIQQLPSLQSLLKLTQKTTKKLQCLNLYSQMDKRDFDLEIEEQNIYSEMNELYKAISAVQQQAPTEQEIQIIDISLKEIKQKYTRTFDVLTKQEEIINQEFALIQKLLKQTEKKDQINQIKELDEYQDQPFQPPLNYLSNDADQIDSEFSNPQVRINKLKLEIDEIHRKVLQINYGKGKWFDTDHKDFIKIYNRCGGKDHKIIQEGIKLLGMKQTQIMDHLQLYENYLQLEKQKKLASQQYKQIKFFEEEQKRQAEQKIQQLNRLQLKLKKEKQMEERLRKKSQIQLYRQKKAEQKQKMINQQEENKAKMKAPPLQPSKKKQIIERNRIFIENQQKKLLQQKSKKQSIQNKKIEQIRKYSQAKRAASSDKNSLKKIMENAKKS